MDRSQQLSDSILPGHEQLRQIRAEVSRSESLDDLRFYFDRLQYLRRTYPDDFDLQVSLAESHDEIIERGRFLRDTQSAATAPSQRAERDRQAGSDVTEPGRRTKRETAENWTGEKSSVGSAQSNDLDIPGAQEIDSKTWQRATYLALFFALLLFFAFFYLIQTARRLNFPQPEAAKTVTSSETAHSDSKPVQPGGNQPVNVPSAGPSLRIYTDLIPATLVLDDGEPREIKDGELTVDKLDPGRHSIRVSGKYGNAALSFDVNEGAAPRVIGQPAASNVMAVAVSTEGGRGVLTTNADHPAVLIDGETAGDADTNEIALENLGQKDHDLQVTESKDRQRFVLTYTQAPALTVYIKSDPNAGTVVVAAGEDGADIYVDDALYRRRTEHGQIRIPLKVGDYNIRVHKSGFLDPAPQTVHVNKAEEARLEFKLDPLPEAATLQIKGALPGTMVYVDKEFAASIAADGNATLSNLKPGTHAIELRREQAEPKRFERTVANGQTIVLTGPDVQFDKAVAESKPVPPPAPADVESQVPGAPPSSTVQIEGQQVRRGGGFIPYHVPKTSGHYSFQAQVRKGGLFKRGKVQWYAGYVNNENYILFTLDGKRAVVKRVVDGKSTELGRTDLTFDGDEWVQVDMSVKPNGLLARVKPQNGSWQELTPVDSAAHDLTQDRVGMYIPGNDEVAIANFRFSSR